MITSVGGFVPFVGTVKLSVNSVVSEEVLRIGVVGGDV